MSTQCKRLSLDCGGYSRSFTFKDQTATVARKARNNVPKQQQACGDSQITLGVSPASPPSTTLSEPEPRVVQLGQSSPETDSFKDTAMPSFDTDSSIPATSEELEMGTEIASVQQNNEAQSPSTREALSPLQWDLLSCDMPADTRMMNVTDGFLLGGLSPSDEVVDRNDLSFAFPADGQVVNPWSVHEQWNIPPVSQTCSTIPDYLLNSYHFPEDILYYHHMFDTTGGLIKNTTIVQLLRSELGCPHAFKAALALSALDLLKREGNRLKRSKEHALQHYINAIKDLQSHTTDLQPSTTSHEQLPKSTLSCLFTTLLLAKFDLRRGLMLTWLTHLRAAASIVTTWYEKLQQVMTGRILWQDFSRMALLLEIYNADFSLHRNGLLSNEAAQTLNETMRGSGSPQDRLLPILKEVIKFEVEYRSQAEYVDHKVWVEGSKRLLHQLKTWHDALPTSELPVEGSLDTLNIFEDAVEVPENEECRITDPITFVYSEDPYTAAINYVHYLTSCLRARTKYLPKVGRLPYSGSNAVVRVICRIAAGLKPSYSQTESAYGHGILPALMNAYYSASNTSLRRWIRAWIGRLEIEREGIWNVSQSKRIMSFVDSEYGKRGSIAEWEIIELTVVDEDREDLEVTDEKTPFKIFIRSRNKLGWSIDYLNVP